MGNEKERRRRGNRNDVKGAAKKPYHNRHHPNNNDTVNNPRNNGAIAPPPIHPPPPSSSGGYKPHNTLLVQFTEETPTWYDCGRNTAGRDDTVFSVIANAAENGNKKKKATATATATATTTNVDDQQQRPQSSNTRDVISRYRRLADEVYSQEVSLSRQGGSGSVSEKDEKWVENTMRRGTLKDRVAAMSVVVNMDCMHKLYALDMLMDLAGCGGGGDGGGGSAPNSRVGQMASEALSDLFVNTLLPGDRKLVSLDDRPLHLYEGTDRTLSPRVLLLWRYEEMIKVRYSSYLARYLGRALAGEDEPSKRGALSTACTLLMRVPEGEEALLAMIVNKIGDPVRKIASAAGHQLRMVLDEHPAMVNVVAREVSRGGNRARRFYFIFRRAAPG